MISKSGHRFSDKIMRRQAATTLRRSLFALKGLPNPSQEALSWRLKEPRSPMCRWIAYRGETIKLERYVTAPAHSLVVQSLRSLEGNASTNGDGFGLGWYDAHDREPGLRSEEHTSELQSQSNLVCRLLLEKNKTTDPS